MLTIPPPVSNAERQRNFRERNPGYYQRLQARKRAGVRAELEAMAMVAPTPEETLALPAPVEVLELPGLNLLHVQSDASSAREMVAIDS